MPLLTNGCEDGWAHDDWFRVPLSGDDSPLGAGCSLPLAGYYALAAFDVVALALCSLAAAWQATRAKGRLQRFCLAQSALNTTLWAFAAVSAPFASSDGARGVNSYILLAMGMLTFFPAILGASAIFAKVSFSVTNVSLADLQSNKFLIATGVASVLLCLAAITGIVLVAGADPWRWESEVPARVALGFRCFCLSSGLEMGVLILVVVVILSKLIQTIDVSDSNMNKTTTAKERFKRFRTMLLLCSPLAVGCWVAQVFILPLTWWLFLLHTLNVALASAGLILSLKHDPSSRGSAKGSIRISGLVSGTASARPSLGGVSGTASARPSLGGVSGTASARPSLGGSISV